MSLSNGEIGWAALREGMTLDLLKFLQENGVETAGSSRWQLYMWAGRAWESHMASLIVDVATLELSFGWQSGDIEWSVGSLGRTKRESGWMRVGLDDPRGFEKVLEFVRRGQTGELPSDYWDQLKAGRRDLRSGGGRS